MQLLFAQKSPKESINLGLNRNLLKKCKDLKTNLSATLEQALSNKLAKLNSEKWADENKSAIQAYNQFVDEHGCFGDEFREF
jgi:antitoxin CcdA